MSNEYHIAKTIINFKDDKENFGEELVVGLKLFIDYKTLDIRLMQRTLEYIYIRHPMLAAYYMKGDDNEPIRCYNSDLSQLPI